MRWRAVRLNQTSSKFRAVNRPALIFKLLILIGYIVVVSGEIVLIVQLLLGNDFIDIRNIIDTLLKNFLCMI